MNIFLILFLISLLGILFILRRKTVMLRKGVITPEGEFPWKVPETEEVKYLASKNLRKIGYIVLVIIIHAYLKSSDLIKESYHGVRNKLKKIINKRNLKPENRENKEVSGFLKMVSEYKEKVRKIKNKIREEENLK